MTAPDAQMQKDLPRNVLIILILTALVLLATACEESGDLSYSLLPEQHDVDPVFRDFYELLGGLDTLGPPISPLFIYNNVKYQYTIAALLVYDAYQPDGQRFQLAALGLDLGIAEPPVQQPEGENSRYINGHVIYSGFVPFYERLSGIRYVGKPLSEVHYNAAKRRYEQHFENLGFFWMEDTPVDEVYLLAYGAWKCDSSCRRPQLGSAEVVLPYRVAKPFAESVERLNPSFTGFAISEAYQTPDGFTEQVYENLVLAFNAQYPAQIFPRAITTRLGYQPEPLRPRRVEDGYHFYEIQDNLGYNIPLHFWEYLSNHGGVEVSGAPISELSQVKNNLNRQCFVNLCLDEERLNDSKIRVRPAPLGYSYRLLPVVEVRVTQELPEYPAPTQPEVQPQTEPVQAPSTVAEEGPAQEPTLSPDVAPLQEVFSTSQSGEMSVQVWESLPMVNPNQNQEIGVSVFMDGIPVRDLEPDLVVLLPEGNRTYYMFPTGADGQSRQILEPINAPNGTLIPYEVCIYSKNMEKFCVRDSFLIWQNP